MRSSFRRSTLNAPSWPDSRGGARRHPRPRIDVPRAGRRAPAWLSMTVDRTGSTHTNRSPINPVHFTYGYATLWFTTPFLLASLVTLLITLLAYRYPQAASRRALAPYPQPESKPAPSLVLGETHFERTPGRSPSPTWLTIPQRGLYTGVMILGAVGSGKTSACMYPYLQQLLRWRAEHPAHKIGGLVLEVKGDFCTQVHKMLTAANRPDDYLEVGLNTGVCYNPLHNDLDPYAVAYAVSSLLNNCSGNRRSRYGHLPCATQLFAARAAKPWSRALVKLLAGAVSRRPLHGVGGQARSHTAAAIATCVCDRACSAPWLASRGTGPRRPETPRLTVDQRHASTPFHIATPPTITNPIVWLASAPSRLSASLRPREAGLTALTGPRASHARHLCDGRAVMKHLEDR